MEIYVDGTPSADFVAYLDNFAIVPADSEPPLEGYDAWAADNNLGAVDEDEDFDGLNNLLEYALNGNPTNDVDAINPVLEKVDGDFNVSKNPGKFTEEDVRAVCKVKGNVYV